MLILWYFDTLHEKKVNARKKVQVIVNLSGFGYSIKKYTNALLLVSTREIMNKEARIYSAKLSKPISWILRVELWNCMSIATQVKRSFVQFFRDYA